MTNRVQVCLAMMLVLIMPLMMGSSCQVDAAMDRVRDVHSGVVAAFRATDEIIAPMYTRAGDECIAEVQERGLEGADARTAARVCMDEGGWNAVEEALAASRHALAELEEIYDDIENGQERYSDWQSIAVRLLAHGRNIVTVLEAAGVDVPDDLRGAIDSLCDMTNCEGD